MLAAAARGGIGDDMLHSLHRVADIAIVPSI
jgi:hypothetical protein